MLVAPFDIGGRDRRAIVKLEAGAEPEQSALGVLGELEMLGERRMIEFPIVEILYQRVMQRIEEIVRGRGPVMLLRVEPAWRDVGVPAEHHLAIRNDRLGRRAGFAQQGDCQPACR